MVDRDDGAHAPLIEDDERGLSDHAQDGSSRDNGTTSPSAFIWALTFAAGISGLLFGYDTGVISSTLVSIGEDLGHPLTNSGQKSYHLLHESERSYCQPSRRAPG